MTIKEQLNELANDVCFNICKHRAELYLSKCITVEDEIKAEQDFYKEHCSKCPVMEIIG